MIAAAVSSYLLPEGYPASVSSDYVAYQTWDTLQGLMAYLKGVICTLSLMRSLGVGRAGASVEHALLLWILKDCTASVAGLAAGHPALTKRFADRRAVRGWRLASEATHRSRAASTRVEEVRRRSGASRASWSCRRPGSPRRRPTCAPPQRSLR